MGVAVKDFRMAIKIDNSEAKQKFVDTKKEIDGVRAAMNKLDSEGKSNSKEYKSLKKQLDQLNTSYAAQRAVVGRTALTYEELRKGARALKTQMDRAVPGTEKWHALRADYMLTRQRMKELEVQAGQTRFSLSKMTDGFNKYAAIGTTFIATLTGTTFVARKCVDEYAKMEEAQADVRKYTGMTTEEVRDLNEALKEMDTRTAREKLNALASDAGRLGITAKEDILEFVDAANIINVALGEDLGDDAVKNIGKLAQMFGDDKDKGLRGAMLATASAVNEVAQNSSAAENYLVEFTARVAGAANQANVAQADIIGFASVLDQNMQKQEMAATAFQNLMMKMYQDPAKFAKMMGENVADFTKLIKEDANEAILQLLDTLNQKGGLDELAPMFKEMGLDGVRAAGVISTLAGKIDDVRTAQQLANQAYDEGTSAINEFNVKNNTVEADLEKRKKYFKEMQIELGEKLLPMMRYMYSTGSMTVKMLLNIVSVFSQYKTTIIAVTLAVIGYAAAVNGSIIADKLKVFWTDKLIVKTKVLYALFKAHPLGALITIGAALVALLIDTNRQLTESERLIKRVSDIRNSATEAVKSETGMLKDYLKIAKDETRSKSEREAAIRRINDISPEYLGNITLEKINTQEATAAVNKYIDSLLLMEEIKHSQTRINELQDQKKNIENNGVDNGFWSSVQAGAATMLNQFKSSMGLYSDAWADNVINDYINKGVNELRSIDREITMLTEHINDNRKKLADLQTSGDGNDNNNVGGSGGGGGDIDEEEFKRRSEMLKQAFQNEQNILKEALLNKQITQEEYQKAMYDAEINYLAQSKVLNQMYAKDVSSIQGQLLDKMISEADRQYKEQQDCEKKNRDESSKALQDAYQNNLTNIKQAYLNGDIRSEEEYQAKIKELERDFLNSRKEMLQKFGQDVTAINNQILDAEMKAQKDKKDKQKSEGFAAIDATDSLKEQLNLLQAMYDADLISYEEYENEKTRIAEDKTALRNQIIAAGLDAVGDIANSFGQIFSAMQDKEVNSVSSAYDEKIKAARKAGKDTTELEEQKEAEILEIKKKYADKQFAMNILDIISQTARAAMVAWTAGPFIGPILGAAALAQGAAQLVVAKSQRDQAKGLKTGGYSDEYVQGYTTSGNPNDVAGVIPVHKNEFVTNHEGVANPHVRQFLDVFDMAQKNGSIRMLNTTQILEHVRTRSGKYAGGYSTDNASTSSNSYYNSTNPDSSQLLIFIQKIIEILNAILDKDLIVDARKVRDEIKKVEKLESNAKRS